MSETFLPVGTPELAKPPRNAALMTLVGVASVVAIVGLSLLIVSSYTRSSLYGSGPDYGQLYAGIGLLASEFWIWVGLLFFWAWRNERNHPVNRS